MELSIEDIDVLNSDYHNEDAEFFSSDDEDDDDDDTADDADDDDDDFNAKGPFKLIHVLHNGMNAAGYQFNGEPEELEEILFLDAHLGAGEALITSLLMICKITAAYSIKPNATATRTATAVTTAMMKKKPRVRGKKRIARKSLAIDRNGKRRKRPFSFVHRKLAKPPMLFHYALYTNNSGLCERLLNKNPLWAIARDTTHTLPLDIALNDRIGTKILRKLFVKTVALLWRKYRYQDAVKRCLNIMIDSVDIEKTKKKLYKKLILFKMLLPHDEQTEYMEQNHDRIANKQSVPLKRIFILPLHQCSICFEYNITCQLPCGHFFHLRCILCTYAFRCPNCRSIFNLNGIKLFKKLGKLQHCAYIYLEMLFILLFVLTNSFVFMFSRLF